MTDTFVVTAVRTDDNDHHVGSGHTLIVMVSPTGQVESGHVYPAHLDGTLEDHLIRRIRELFNVGLCHGWGLMFSTLGGGTQVFNFDFDSVGPKSGERLPLN